MDLGLRILLLQPPSLASLGGLLETQCLSHPNPPGAG